MDDRKFIGFTINLSLLILAGIVTIRHYGIHAMLTGRRMRHAAKGRAKRVWRAGRHTRTIVGNNLRATELIIHLRRERQDMAWRTYHLNVRTA